MLRTDYPEEDLKRLQKLRYTYPDTRIMRRFEILWLHSCGKFTQEIANIVQQTPSTVRDVIKMFQNGGIKLVTTIDSNHPKNELEDHRVSIIEEFTKRPPASAKEAFERIFKLTAIRRSVERVRVFMKSLGMTFRKVRTKIRRPSDCDCFGQCTIINIANSSRNWRKSWASHCSFWQIIRRT